MTNPAHPSTAASFPAHRPTPAHPDAAWNKSPADGAWRRFGSALPMRASLVAVAIVWGLGCVWSYQEQSAFAASKGFAFPHLLPLVIDGFAVSMAAVSWAASLDARPAIPARMATVVAVGASSASNGVWAYLRTQHDMVTVVLGIAVPIAANLAFEVLLAELRRQVQRRRGLPPPVAVPYPRLIRVFLAPWQTFRAWRSIVLELTSMDRAVNPASNATLSRPAPVAAVAAAEPYPESHPVEPATAPTAEQAPAMVDTPPAPALRDRASAVTAPARPEHAEPAYHPPAPAKTQPTSTQPIQSQPIQSQPAHSRHAEPPTWSARLDHPEATVTLPHSTAHAHGQARPPTTNGVPLFASSAPGPAQGPRSPSPPLAAPVAAATNGHISTGRSSEPKPTPAAASTSRPPATSTPSATPKPPAAAKPPAAPKSAAATRRQVSGPAPDPQADPDENTRSVGLPASSSRRPIDQRVERLAQHLATAEDGDELTGERVAQLLGIDVAPRTGRRLLGQARELLNQRMAREQGVDDELSVIGGR